MEDNRAVMALTEQNMSHNGTRTKHMDLKYKWIEEQVEAGTLVPQYTPTNLNPADIFRESDQELTPRNLQQTSQVHPRASYQSNSSGIGLRGSVGIEYYIT